MAEQRVNKITDYLGLEILLKVHLNQLAYKSDLVILFTHYILTKSLGYDYVEIIKNDENESYNIMEILPPNWNQLPGTYNLIYKKDDIIKIVHGTKKNDSFVLYMLKEDSDREQISGQIELNTYIPDEFFDANHTLYKNLRSIRNIGNLMNILNSTILGNSNVKFKKLFDIDLVPINDELQERIPVVNEQTSLVPPPRYAKEIVEPKIGEFCLQCPSRHVPVDVNRDVNLNVYNSPEYYIQEDLDGEPSSSIYN